MRDLTRPFGYGGVWGYSDEPDVLFTAGFFVVGFVLAVISQVSDAPQATLVMGIFLMVMSYCDLYRFDI